MSTRANVGTKETRRQLSKRCWMALLWYGSLPLGVFDLVGSGCTIYTHNVADTLPFGRDGVHSQGEVASWLRCGYGNRRPTPRRGAYLEEAHSMG